MRPALEAISAEVGGFDVVINNAAIYPSKKFEDYTIEEMQTVQRINVDAGIVCVQVALPHMRENGWGGSLISPALPPMVAGHSFRPMCNRKAL